MNVEELRLALPQFVDALTDAVVMIDRNRRIVAANRRYLETFGAQSGTLVGAVCHEVLSCPEAHHPDIREHCAACQVLDNGEPRRLLRSLPDSSGALRRWEAVLSPVRDAAGQVSHIVEVWRDITDRSQLEGQLAHSERLASLGILAAGVAHEINNPMASIVAAVDVMNRWLRRNATLPADERTEIGETLGMLEDATRRCGETTDKLLLLAQPYEISPSWLSLNQAVEDTLSLLGFQIRRQGIIAETDLDTELPPLWGRDSGLRGICMNLCLNAVQAMPGGGRLRVSTRYRDHRAELVVEDNGPGVPAGLMDRIWDPFFTTKPPGEGTGLGLSITHQVVVRHGGAIHVETAPGGGARFVINLPVAGPGGDDV